MLQKNLSQPKNLCYLFKFLLKLFKLKKTVKQKIIFKSDDFHITQITELGNYVPL